ncbi:MAG: WG repeat-containing protein [Saprospiraceae bacterium]|nr:WG repeat-containing protein [Saprospiraceae bacterium]
MRLPFTSTFLLFVATSLPAFSQEPNEAVRIFPLRQLVGDRYETLACWDFKNQLYLVRENGLFGLIDAQGKELVVPEYNAFYFAGLELIPVQKNKKWGAFNRKGRLVIPIQYDAVWCFDDSRFVSVQQDSLSAVFDENGKAITPFEYAGYVSISQNKIHGRFAGQVYPFWRDSLGKRFAPEACDHCEPLFASYWRACREGFCAVFDPDGQQLTDFIFPDRSIIPLPGNRLAVEAEWGDDRYLFDFGGKQLGDSVVQVLWLTKEKVWVNISKMRGFLGADGSFIPMPQGFSLSVDWSDRKGSLVKIFKQIAPEPGWEDEPMEVYGWADSRTGKWMPPHFTKVVFWNDKIVAHEAGTTFIFSQDNNLLYRFPGYVRLFPGAPCGTYRRYDHIQLIDSSFHYLTTSSYERIEAADWGGLLFTRDGKWGLLDTKGKEVLPPEFERIEPSEPNGQLLTVQVAGKKGVVDINGRTVLEAGFEFIRGIPGSNFAVGVSGKYGIINKKNEVILPLEYDSIYVRFDGRIMVVRRGDRFGMVNFKGQILLPVEYEQLGMEDYGWIIGVRNGLYNAWNANVVGMDSFKYDWWSPEYPYGFIVKKDGKAGFLNLLGKELLPLQYDDIRRVYPEPGVYHVLKNGQTTMFKP